MISKGLKVGDTFTDGGTPYIVLKVCEDGNYISRRCTPEEVKNVAENPQEKSEEKVEETEKNPEMPQKTARGRRKG